MRGEGSVSEDHTRNLTLLCRNFSLIDYIAWKSSKRSSKVADSPDVHGLPIKMAYGYGQLWGWIKGHPHDDARESVSANSSSVIRLHDTPIR